MANEKEVKIKLVADDKQARETLDNYIKTLKESLKTVQVASRDMNLGESFSKVTKDLASKYSDVLTKSFTIRKDVYKDIGKFEGRIKELSSDIVKITQSSGVKVTGEVKKTLEKVNGLIKKSSEEAKKETTSGGFAQFLNSFKYRAGVFVSYRAISGIANGLNSITKAAVELESAFANIQAITAASDTTMEKLRGTILRVGEASKYSVEDIARATTMLGQAGLTAEEINDVLETTTQLAAGTGSELSNTVDLMTSALAVWGLNSEEASHLSDVMVTGMNRTKATLETFRMAVQYAGATMSSLNVSFDEFASVAAAASNAGLRASVVGTGLRAMTSELISPTKKMVRGLAQLGLSTEDVNIETQGLVNVLYKLKNAGLSAGNAYDLFGKRAAQFVLAAQGQLDVVDELRNAFNESGATLKAYETQMNTLSAQWTAFKNNVKGSTASMLELISGMLQGILKSLNDIFRGIKRLFSDGFQVNFEETAEKLEDEKKSAKSFYDFVEQLRKRDYGGDTAKAIDDLNEVIDAMNEKFGKTISYVDGTKKLADEFERIKNEAKQIGELRVADLEMNRNERANQLLGKKNFAVMGALSNKYGRDLSQEYEAYRSQYYEDLVENGGNISKIQREIKKTIQDSGVREAALIALEDAKKIFEVTGGAIKSTFKSNEFNDALIELEKTGKKTSTDIKTITTKLNENAKSLGKFFGKTQQLSLDEINDVLAKAETAENELRELNERDTKKWDEELDKLGILKEDEREEYKKEIKDLKKKAVENYTTILRNLLDISEKELARNISTTANTQIRDLISAKVGDLDSIYMSDWEAHLNQASAGNKYTAQDRKTQRDIERERARKFNQKYQRFSLQTQADSYAQDIAEAQRKGAVSKLQTQDTTGTLSSYYSTISADLSKLESLKTALANKKTFEAYQKDYGDIFKQVQEGQVTLEDAEYKTDGVISKMIDLEKNIKSAEAEFGDLNSIDLSDIDSQIDTLNGKLKLIGESGESELSKLGMGFAATVDSMSRSYTSAKIGSTIANDLGTGMSDALYSVADGTKSMKEAFSDMAKSILEDISKMLIKMAVLKTMETAVGMYFGSPQVYDSAIGPTQTANSQGLFMLSNGGFIPKLRAAAGKLVRGGIQGRDSVPAMVMPGEYILKKSAVDALGTNFLNDLNNNAAQTLAGTAASLVTQNPWEESSTSEPAVVNVWVVSKEEEAQMGPNDIIATIGKDIMTGGQTRRLIQSVVAGRK